MALFLEGVEAISQPCSLVVLLPALALVLVGRAGRATIALSYLCAASLLMWAKAAGHWSVSPRGTIVVVIALGIAATFGGALRPTAESAWFTGAGMMGGAIAGWMWQPCVGAEFGAVLNDASGGRPLTLLSMVVYVAGVLLPALMVAALPTAVPPVRRSLDHGVTRVAGLVFGAAYALTVAVGRYDDLVGELFRRSSA